MRNSPLLATFLILILLNSIISGHYQNMDGELNDNDDANFQTAENNADPTLESLRAIHVKDDHFMLPNNFTTLDFTITNSSEYIFAGYFSGTVMLNSSHSITSNSSTEDILVLRADFNGTVIDYFHAGGSGDDRARGMDIDPSGNVYLGGYMGGNMTLGNTNYFTDDREGLVLKLDPNFNPVWSNNVTTHGNGNEIADVDWGGNDSIAIAGNCEGTKVNNVVTSISFGTTVTYNRCGTFFTSNAPVTWGSGVAAGGQGTNMYVGKLNETGDWQWAKKTEGCRTGGSSCPGNSLRSTYLDVNSVNVWHDSGGYIVAQGRSSMTQATNTNNWCASAGSYRGLLFGSYAVDAACSPGIFMAKLTGTGTVYKIVNYDRGWGAPSSDAGFGGESVLDSGQFAFHTQAVRVTEHGITASGSHGPCGSTVGQPPNYHISWMNESLCTRDGYSRFAGTGSIGDVSLTSGNSSEPQIIATFLGTGTITLGSDDIVLSAANTPIVGQINTSNGSASATGFGWGWSLSLPSYSGYSITGTEVSELGEIHIVLRSGRDTLLRITEDADGDGSGHYSDKFPNDPTQWSDFDNDGFGDQPTGNNPDGCVTLFGNSTIDLLGCPDYDGDGWSDTRDRFPGESSQWNDSDWDGYGDNPLGFQPDGCLNIWGNSNRNLTGAYNGDGAIFGCPDDDFDGFANTIDDCLTYGDSAFGIQSGSIVSYIGCPDSDRDRFEDNTDPCPLQYGSSTVDRYGCPDADGDGISDLRDPRPNHAATSDNDWDGDTHIDYRSWTNQDMLSYSINGPDVFPNDHTQWSDTDGDGYGDNPSGNDPDAFPNDPNEYSDLDGDGIGDEADECKYEYGNSTLGNSLGCTDSDGDGWADREDAFPNDGTQWLDADGDGWGDNAQGNNADAFPDNSSEWMDTDGDGVGDNSDAFPLNPSEQADSDGDGMGDNADLFPQDATETRDNDGDGVGNNADTCPGSDDNLDADGDGIPDGCDTCPNDDGNDADKDGACGDVDAFPYDASETMDTDGDGVGDNGDAFRFDANESVDTDGDGIGDNADQCPAISGDMYTIPIGCPDTDRDGYADANDRFFTDPNEWDDSDSDGIGDNADYCPFESGNSSLGDAFGCIDSDLDGWADIIDVWPANNRAWSDSDGDNFTDQPGLDFSDDCPSQSGNSTITMYGCTDMDGDGIPDVLDPDADGDGIFNAWEYQMEPASDAFNASDTPSDNDGDGVPDYFDEDDDNDGFPDEVEEQRGSDPFSASSDPLEKYGGGTYYVPGKGFSSEYESEGYEISISKLLVLAKSELLALVFIAPMSIWGLTRRKRLYNSMKKKIDLCEDAFELDNIDAEINEIIEKGRLKIEQSLLLRNIFENQQDAVRGHANVPETDPMTEDLPDFNETEEVVEPAVESVAESPPITETGVVGEGGYEWIKWPEGSQDQWYRTENSGAEWKKWQS